MGCAKLVKVLKIRKFKSLGNVEGRIAPNLVMDSNLHCAVTFVPSDQVVGFVPIIYLVAMIHNLSTGKILEDCVPTWSLNASVKASELDPYSFSSHPARSRPPSIQTGLSSSGKPA